MSPDSQQPHRGPKNARNRCFGLHSVQKGTRAVPNDNNHKFYKISFRIPKIPPIEPTSLGKYIKKLRLEKQLQQKDLAKLIDASAQSIQNWEADRRLPNRASFIKLADLFKIPEETFFIYMVERKQSVGLRSQRLGVRIPPGVQG